VVVAAPPGTA